MLEMFFTDCEEDRMMIFGYKVFLKNAYKSSF